MKYLNWSISIKERMLNYLRDYEYSRLNGLNIRHSLINSRNLDKEMFYKHLVGFTDGDGSFGAGRRDNGNRYAPRYRVSLHKDDIEYLEFILKQLDIDIKIYIQSDKATLFISKISDLNNKVIPIFDKYKLLGTKAYDYKLWRELYYIYMNKDIIKSNRLELCNKLNENLNKKTDLHIPNYDYIINNINNEYIIGFIEAEGYFGVKSQNNKYNINIEITQHIDSIMLIKSIQNTIINWPCDNNLNYELKPLTNKLYPDKNKYRIIISGVDRLYYQIIPIMLNNELYTRKYIDFIMWTVSVIIIKHGLHKTTIGVDLLNHIRSTINSKRYNTNNKNLPSLNDIMQVLDITPIYNPTLSHEYNYRNNRKSKL